MGLIHQLLPLLQLLLCISHNIRSHFSNLTNYVSNTYPTHHVPYSISPYHPTASVPTPFPTASTPTSYPTETAPTIKPTIACKAKGESCNINADCCMNKCN